MLTAVREMLEQHRQTLMQRESMNAPELTLREREVMRGICKGQLNKQIGSDLNIAERTVKFYVSKLLARFSVTNRTALAAIMRQRIGGL